MHFGKQLLHVHAEANIVLVVYAHRVKQFQEESGGDPSAVLIPALLDKTVPVQPLSGLSFLLSIHASGDEGSS